jgi:hypothetical protein
MAAGQLYVANYMPAIDPNGDPISGARFYFYENGTTTAKATYTSSALTTQHSHPVESDTAGIFPAIWADDAEEFTVAVTDGDGAPLDAYDDLTASTSITSASVALAQSAATAAENSADDAETAAAQAEAIAADLSGAPFQATSVTSLTIGTGTKSLTLAQTGKLFALGQTVVVARTSAPLNQMTGIVTAFTSSSGAMTVEVSAIGGSGGPFTDWTVALSSAGGVLSIVGETGVVTRAEFMAAVVPVAADITNFNTAVDARAIAFAIALA